MSLGGGPALDETGDGYVVSLVRAILGAFLLVTALRTVDAVLGGRALAGAFHVSILPEPLVAPRAVLVALSFVQVALAVLVIAGGLARPSLLATALIGLYVLACDRTEYHNNRYALFLFSLLVAFAPCDRAFVWRGPRLTPGQRTGPLWACRLAQVQLALIYLSSGGSKLLDTDWRQGRVLADHLFGARQVFFAPGLSTLFRRAQVVWIHGLAAVAGNWVSLATLSSGMAKLAIATELFLAVGLFVPRARGFALWLGVMFHLTNELTTPGIELFGWLCPTIYALFAAPALRERAIIYDPAHPRAVAAVRALAWLDWLARFEARPGPTPDGAAFVVVERDGTSASGLTALARVARATPILFPLSVPLSALAVLDRQGAARLRAQRAP